VGKEGAALALLARLACAGPDPASADPCGQCRSCRAFVRGDHPDVSVLRRQGATILIGQVREALGRLRYEPVVGAAKGLVVADADLLREEAANALLKTLEEPSSRTYFVLTTARPQLVIGTIESRCQRLRFGPLPAEVVAEALVAEGVAADAALVAAALAEGSLTAARELCDPGRLDLVDRLARFTVALGQAPELAAPAFLDDYSAALAQAGKGGGPTVGARGSEAEADRGREDAGEPAGPTTKGGGFDREALRWAVDVIASVLRDAMLVAEGAAPERLAHRRHAAGLAALAARAGALRLARAIAVCQALDERMAFNPNPRLCLEATLVAAGSALRTRIS
jgi:DNA polymerase-3 subunit delta'